MSNEFYDYIAKQIIEYFTTNADDVNKGERYSLRLDDEEMVRGVDSALRKITNQRGIQGQYAYKSVYNTFTIKIHDNELVIASKIDGMTDDFLATLRNEKLTDQTFPILMITYSPIDTIISGTADLTVIGMPFNSQTLIEKIGQSIEVSGISVGGKIMLRFELDRKKRDRFSDNSSLFEYSTLLMILGKGKVEGNDFNALSLIKDEDVLTINDEKEVENRLNQNHELYQEIDYAFKYGDISEKLDKDYDKSFIKSLKQKKGNKEKWYNNLTLDEVLKSREKKNKKVSNPLDVVSIDVYSGTPLEHRFVEDETLFIANDAETKSGKRRKNILIFNPQAKETISIELGTNLTVSTLKKVQSDNVKVACLQKVLRLDFAASGCSFAYFECEDSNAVKYRFRICVINVAPEFLGSLNTKYTIYAGRTLRGCSLTIEDVQSEIAFNIGKENEITCIAEEGGIFQCGYSESLRITLPEEAFNLDTDKLEFTIKSGSVEIPLTILNREKQKQELTGVGCFKKKYASELRLKYSPRTKSINQGTTPYIVKDPFRSRLAEEWKMISEGWLAAEVTTSREFSEMQLNVPEEVSTSYRALCDVIREHQQTPSLIRYEGEYLLHGRAYIAAINNVLGRITEGTLSDADNDCLKIGCVFDSDSKIIKMTTLHPLNVLYQMVLSQEVGIDSVRDDLIKKLSPRYLLPYIRGSKSYVYKAVEENDPPEWWSYSEIDNRRFLGSRQFVKKLVVEKIEEYKKHFDFLFEGMDNRNLCINLIDMGDCQEVFNGIIQYFFNALRSEEPYIENYEINIYNSHRNGNAFINLGNSSKLKAYLEQNQFGERTNELSDVLMNHVSCYFRENNDRYEYAHLTFIEMKSLKEAGAVDTKTIATGASLDGLLSGVPSVLDGEYYKTGYGIKYASDNELINLASIYNALFTVAYTFSSFESGKSIVTSVPKRNDEKLQKVYDSSNWIVFVDPKVDLSYFKETDKNNLMIIHYSDQLSSSSSYDDITVTNKSNQYTEIIREQLALKGVQTTGDDIKGIINLFNAINGSWLLHLITAKKFSGAVDSNFSREKMSILSAIKLAMAAYSHPDVIWVPLSLEEMLRVSRGTGLSQKEGILSARNLGFENRPTCDDILMVGIEGPADDIKVYIHPIEVKIGINDESYIDKAITQVTNTHDELIKNMWPSEGASELSYKLIRNFIMQLVVVSAEKMRLYNIYPEENWEKILDEYRHNLLNDIFEVSDDLDEKIGKGTVVSFRTGKLTLEVTESGDGKVKIFDFPEKNGSNYMVRSIEEIRKELNNDQDVKQNTLIELYPHVQNKTQNMSTTQPLSGDLAVNNDTDTVDESVVIETIAVRPEEQEAIKVEDEDVINKAEHVDSIEENDDHSSMSIEFGTDISTGNKVIWTPNDTNILFHTNTGIIGTMGTGKTQFTKSLVTQLIHHQEDNCDGSPLGVLIFDYKGDYNESKEDFINATGAQVFHPYHLPFNPFALTKSKVFKPLLPKHTANAFKDTISKIYALGPKQQDVLFQCIIEAYAAAGIRPADASSWENDAPTFEQVFQKYNDDEEIKKNDSLAAAMNKLHEFEIFEANPANTKSLFDVLNGVVVIDISGYDPDIQSLIIAITLDLFYAQMQASGSSVMKGQYRQLTRMILVDEADNFMSEGFPALKKIMKEGREFGVGVILSTQFLKHFGGGDDDYSKYILSWIVHNVADLKPADVDFVFNTEPKSTEEQRLFNDIKKLQKHHSIVKIGTSSPRYIEDLPFWKLIQD